VLEPSDPIIGIAHDDHVAPGMAPPPLLDPQVERVVQVDSDLGCAIQYFAALLPFHWLAGFEPRDPWPGEPRRGTPPDHIE
jgi:hypothetical protein